MSDGAVCAQFVHYPLIKNNKKNKMIMKKNYFKPEVEMFTLLAANMLALSSGPGYESTESDGSDLGAKENRGEWGNVWGGGGSN